MATLIQIEPLQNVALGRSDHGEEQRCSVQREEGERAGDGENGRTPLEPRDVDVSTL